MSKTAAKIEACKTTACPKCQSPAGTVCKADGRILAAIAHPARVAAAGLAR